MALPAVLAKAKKAIGVAGKAKAVNDATDGQAGEKVKKFGMIGCGIIAFFPLLALILILVIGSDIFGTIQIADGAEVTNKGGNVEAGSYLEWAANIANDDSHGYSQCARNGPDDYDCSSLVWYALVNGGGFTEEELGGYPFNTHSMPNILENAGFTRHDFNADELEPGDILLQAEHTEIYYGDGQTVGAHNDENGGICGGEAGDSTSHEIDIGPLSSNFTSYYRLEG